MNMESASLRPRDLAVLLLASRDLRPRQRARDQQADLAGLEIKRRMLRQLADLDPEPAEVDSALQGIIDQMGPPFGPTRAIAVLIREEWQTACLCPDWITHLLSEAVDEDDSVAKGRKNVGPGPACD